MPGYAPPTPYGPLGAQTNLANGLQLVDEVLSDVAKQFKPEGYVYDRITAEIPVTRKFGIYPVFDPAAFFSTGGDLEVADDAPTPVVDFNWSTDGYACRNKRLRTRITRDEEQQANSVLRLEYSKTVGLLTQFANNREDRLARALRAIANGGQFTNPVITPAVKWDAGTISAPATIQSDIQSGVLMTMKACGKRPNTIVMDYEVALAISNDPTIRTQLQYKIGDQIFSNNVADMLSNNGQGGGVLPAKMFGLNVIVADGTLQNTAAPGQPVNMAGTWGQSVRLLYIDPNAQWGVPATVYSFRAPVNGTSAQPPQVIMPSDTAANEPGPAGQWAIVDRWWEYDPPATNIRAWECVAEKVVAPELGVEIGPVLSGFSYEY